MVLKGGETAPVVKGDNPVVLLEEGELVPPRKPELGEAMDEQDQRPAKLYEAHSQEQIQ